jgi:hypothetical protein
MSEKERILLTGCNSCFDSVCVVELCNNLYILCIPTLTTAFQAQLDTHNAAHADNKYEYEVRL